MSINNSHNLHILPTQLQSNQTVNFLIDLGRCIFYVCKWYRRDVYWDEEADRYRNGADGRFVADWKGNLFT